MAVGVGLAVIAGCVVLAGSADATRDLDPSFAVQGGTDDDNSGPGGGGDDESTTSTSDGSSSSSSSSTDASTSSTDNSTSSTDGPTSTSDGVSTSGPDSSDVSSPTVATFPDDSWEAQALERCAGQVGDPEFAAQLLAALDPTGATENDRGSRRLPLLVERCAMTFVGDVVPELGRPVTEFEQIVDDELIVVPGDGTNDVTPNAEQLALLDAAAAAAFPTCRPQPDSVSSTSTTAASADPTTSAVESSSSSSTPTSGTTTDSGSTVGSGSAPAENRCVVPTSPDAATSSTDVTTSSEPATGTSVGASSSSTSSSSSSSSSSSTTTG
jgi:hypothetical protein